ncbi:hypothetical protein KY285_007972 [Solanum tuberosum]|nr:hypothetical protein KY289_008377 [Solanum tuberosum]KAH0746315.1 hypothetical protein KY285_007972 [Solanum tuberosum]
MGEVEGLKKYLGMRVDRLHLGPHNLPYILSSLYSRVPSFVIPGSSPGEQESSSDASLDVPSSRTLGFALFYPA